jgi:asparagine synthase (glutamine-hydrolysing)
MCGFIGEIRTDGRRVDGERLSQLARRLAHRGPDDEGLYVSPDGRCAIAFRRLSIIDLAGSHQPMTSPDGRFAVAFNGEIYNYRELRDDLAAEGAAFHTDGEAEVLLELFKRHGSGMVERLGGMFALAAYDATEHRLVLARDRLGEKPLYWAPTDGGVAFASEPGVLLGLPGVDSSLDMMGIQHFLTFGYTGGECSAWSGIHKVSPSHLLELPDGRSRCYWNPEASSDVPASPAAANERVRCELTRAVEAQMAADVPLGALLSGGIDSSIVVGLMSKAAGRAGGVRTFTAGFENAAFDERATARATARHFGTDHTEMVVRMDPAEALDLAISIYDEPFADSSAIPTHLICREARRFVKTALVGDGGDEVFGGYDRYRALHLSATLGPGRFAALKAATVAAGLVAPQNERSLARRLARLGASMSLPTAAQYFSYRSIFAPEQLAILLTDEAAARLDLDAVEKGFVDAFEAGDWADEVARAQHHDLTHYLPDDLLVKTDRAAMAASLELRAPFLDPGVVGLGLSLPAEAKLNWRRGKLILRRAFADMLPPEVLGRLKRGFGVPLDDWLRGPLAAVLREQLPFGPLVEQNLVRREAIQSLVGEHLCGRGDHRHRLWALLVLDRWLARRV